MRKKYLTKASFSNWYKCHHEKLLAILMVFVLLPYVALSAYGQDQRQTVTGTVTDANSMPIIGANVLIKGTNEGSITDVDGKFSVEATSDNILIISFIGYVTQEIQVGSMTNIEVFLSEDTEELSEIVVIGYGTAKKSDLTGAVSSVKGEEIRGTVTANLDQALQGRAGS